MKLRLGPQRDSGLQAGFTLVELALVTAIVAILLAALTVPFQTQVESRKIAETERTLALARDALLIYAARHGYLPCPADASSNGREPPGADHATGRCPVWHGFLPAVTLGFKPTDAQGYALDAWGTTANRIRYAVSDTTIGGVTLAFTRVNGVRMAGAEALAGVPLLHVCASGSGVSPGVDCGSAALLSAHAVGLIWSVGGNAATGGISVDEAQNPNPNGGSADRIFVSRTRGDGNGAEFDDLLAWIPATIFLSSLLPAGHVLPAPGGTGTSN